jgi:hypothetical protein
VQGYTSGNDFFQVANSVALTNNALVQAGYPQYCAPRAQDVAQLASVGQEFCSSYISYVPPTSTSVVLSTPPATTSVLTSVEYSTVVSNSIATVTAAKKKKKREDDDDLLPKVVYIDASTTSLVTAILTGVVKRAAIPTPDLIAHWPAQKISAACSAIATGTALTTVTSVAATPVVTATFVLISTTTSVSISTTTTTAAKVYTPSTEFGLTDSAGNSVVSGGNDHRLVASENFFVGLALDSDSFLHVDGSPDYVSVNSLTGHDQLFFLKDQPNTNKLFCTLQNFVKTSGSLRCSVGGPNGQQSIFQLCDGNYFIGTSVTAGCQQVTMTAQ